MVDIALKNLLYDKTRFVITAVGVTFSVVLVFAQVGIYLGFMQNASMIIDNTDVDIWITSKNSANFDFPLPFTERKLHKVKEVPGVAWADHLLLAWVVLKLPNGNSEGIELVGFNPHTGVGGPWRLKEGSIQGLKAGKGVIVDESSFPRLGQLRLGDFLEIYQNKVRIVGISQGARSLTTAPYVFTAYRTVQEIFQPLQAESTVFIVARVAPGYDPREVVARLRGIRDVDVYTSDQYSLKTRLYWTRQTGLGIGFALTALMGVIVGMVIVGQTLYTATVEHLREFGTLKAIGATNRYVYGIILKQALVSAVIGYVAGLFVTAATMRWYELSGVAMIVPVPVMVGLFFLTVAMCLSTSLLSVRKALHVDPMIVFRT